ncbi:MAG: chromate transporter, partial [Desulfobaccales bacterium]
LLGTANLIPGPSSTEMATFIGYLCKGWAGLLLAGVCFIAPAMVIVIEFAWAYVRFGNLPQITWLLYGVKPVVIAIILQALWQLGRPAVKSKFFGALAIIAVVLDVLGVNILAVLFGTGLITGLRQGIIQDRLKDRERC